VEDPDSKTQEQPYSNTSMLISP